MNIYFLSDDSKEIKQNKQIGKKETRKIKLATEIQLKEEEQLI